MQKLINVIARILKRVPFKYQNKLFEIVLRFIPFWLLMKIPCSYSTYLKCNFPGKGDVIFDCGAHVGNCAILFSRLVGKTGLVISLEPFTEAFSHLEERLRRLKLGNVRAINMGLWNLTAQLPVTVLSDVRYSKINPDNTTDFVEGDAAINVTTIDRIVEEFNLNRLDMIKMDIEGAEIEAVQGASRTLKTLKPCLAIASYHKRDGRMTYKALERSLLLESYTVNTFFPPHLTTCAKCKESMP